MSSTSAVVRSQNRKGQGDLLRVELLTAAERLIVAAGSRRDVTVAAVCAEVGCTAPALYRHFTDKQALVEAVCAVLFDRYAEAFERVVISRRSAANRLIDFGDCYVRFALENPGVYRVLFMHGPDEQLRSTGPHSPLVQMFGYLTHIVEAFITENPMPSNRRAQHVSSHELACLLWSAVHGPVSLAIAKPEFNWRGGSVAFAQRAARLNASAVLTAATAS